jgi:pyruvate,water dikinase
MHSPDQTVPLSESFGHQCINHGFNAAAARYQLPIRARNQRINTYSYGTMSFVGMPPPPVQKVMGAVGRVLPSVVKNIQQRAIMATSKRYTEQIMGVALRLSDYWEREALPEIQRTLAWWEGFDLRAAPLPQLRAHFEATLQQAGRFWELHFLVAFPMLGTMSEFSELYEDLFGKGDTFAPYRLLQGFDNKSLEGDRMLWRLSRKALASPAVSKILEECATHEVMAALEACAECRAFLHDLNAYLNEFGQRADKFDTLTGLSWIEDPSPVIKNLRDYMTQPNRDLAAEQAALATERERLIAEARVQLKGYPQPVVTQFETLLKEAQMATVLQETHNYWIDQRGVYQVRRVLLEFGRRFVEAGVMEAANEIVYLSLDELRETASDLPNLNRLALVAERKAEMERFSHVTPPLAIGTLQGGEFPDDLLGRANARFFGEIPPAADDPNILNGNAGSPGKARGTVKVIRSLSEAGKLQKGDVLVAETTAPPWTPLFATAVAVVTDTGGILSHCAIVAREYHIPAVVGARTATRTLRDGQVVEVDGDGGVVKIVT